MTTTSSLSKVIQMSTGDEGYFVRRTIARIRDSNSVLSPSEVIIPRCQGQGSKIILLCQYVDSRLCFTAWSYAEDHIHVHIIYSNGKTISKTAGLEEQIVV